MPGTVEQTPQSVTLSGQPCGKMANRNRFQDIRHLITSETPLIVDGGAHAGTTIDVFLADYSSPTIVAFEPNPEFAQLLKRKYRSLDNVRVYDKALGASRSTVTFHVLNYPASSSILRPGRINRHYHGEKMEVRRAIEVEQVRLDEVLAGEDVDVLKLDLQGYELEALRGAVSILPRVKVITTEIEFVPLYEGQPLFRDLDAFLGEHGFRLLNLYELYTHPDAQLTAGDAVYLNMRFFGDDLCETAEAT